MTIEETFDIQFSPENLKLIFEEKISKSGTVGKDGVHPSAFEKKLDTELALVIKKVRDKKYNFTPFKQRLILKGAGKPPREISIAGVRDRLVLRAITNVLSSVFSDAKIPAPHHFIGEIKEYIRHLSDEYSFVQLDVKDFYPSLQHAYLVEQISARTAHPELQYLVTRAITTPTGDRTERSEIGVPQGLSISNVLSSIYMMKIDNEARAKLQYFRYVDDILIICRTSEAERNFQYISQQLKMAGLECHALGTKSKVVPLSKSVDYLGYRLSPNLVSVRQSSYQRMMENIMSVITAGKYKHQPKRTLLKLNIKITGCIMNEKRFGWMFFFSMTEDINQLKRLDRFVKMQWEKTGLAQFGKPKKFVKTFHEIRYNTAETKYIPRFDDYTIEKKMELISVMEGLDVSDIRDWTQEKIERKFWYYIRREVADLEKDITPLS
ncbi:RNA-directed DNA polymerase (reverse transcriptase) protein [Sinorhizobium sp. A49]|uniref:reverse transcriptase domain-containing protein n=1 Tax=Sinorhizobium sp. A49 TaxID=1945861 RepID=UPI000986D7DA|nr:reverse transcriptase domain-containing protein [Sinorhizobium sp. A49]OOG73891.1 RNA-directed DNA polymerase (reverse transcriptase) protein [Sinorhizobium sp. A49]